MGTNSARLLPDLFLYSYENEFLQFLIKNKNEKPSSRNVSIKDPSPFSMIVMQLDAFSLHEKYVIVPPDKVSNKILFV